jgi:heterodisulfide reductase subunit C
MSAETTTETRLSFVGEIGNLLHAAAGNPITTCIQCGTCSGTCPVASGGYMDATPRRLIAMIRAGRKEQVLKSNTYWYCASCYQCTVRCPRNIDIAELMYALKRYTIWKGQYADDLIGPVFSQTFVQTIMGAGRSYEPVLATTYLFTYDFKDMLQEAAMATGLMLKGRMPLLPPRIKRLENFKRMVRKIIPAGETT